MQIHNVDYVENVYICGNFSLFYVIIVSHFKIICVMEIYCTNHVCGHWSRPSYCYECYVTGRSSSPVCGFNEPFALLPKIGQITLFGKEV